MNGNTEGNSVSQQAFEAGAPVQLCVREVLSWITDGRAPWGAPGRLTLPPLQRNGVWRPKQVLNLWRSVLEGMPIGLFYLAPPGRTVVDLRDGAKQGPPLHDALDLFDGQQRVRALALGTDDPFEEGRCIWVNFKGSDYELILSSRTQPAGYKPDGSRLSVADRREWYDPLGDVRRREYPGHPAGCSADDTVALAKLLASGTNGDAARPAKATGSAWDKFQEHLAKLTLPCAIFVMLPKHIAGDAERTLELFRRIGAGGTPLSEAEQVYSAYKLRKPKIRDVVEAVHRKVSFLLTPAQVVQAALRMANTLANPNTGWAPGFNIAIRAFSPGAPDADVEPWVQELDALLTKPNGDGSLLQAFETVRALLSEPGHDAYSLPEVVVAQLPAELWQVLAFWCLKARGDLAGNREEVVRFAMAWHLAVTHQERAAQACFRTLAAKFSPVFPGKVLYDGLKAEKGTALDIPEPMALNGFFVTPEGGKEISFRWLTGKQRFPDGQKHGAFAATWWSSRKLLPWLQRGYVNRKFSSYRPLSDHEDDLPYDWDHICPRAHWGPDGRTVWWKQMGFNNEEERKAVMPEPWVVGDSIGNMRLVDFAQNRSDGDKDIFDKMPFLGKPDEASTIGTPADFMLDDPGEISLWKQVSGGKYKWSEPSRRAAFQKVVGLRAARLYREFYDKLGFKKWEHVSNPSAPSDLPRSGP